MPMYSGDSIVCAYIHLFPYLTLVWMSDFIPFFVCVYGIMELFFLVTDVFYLWLNKSESSHLREIAVFAWRECDHLCWAQSQGSRLMALHSLIRSQTVSCSPWSPQLTHTHTHGPRNPMLSLLSKSFLLFWLCSCRKLITCLLKPNQAVNCWLLDMNFFWAKKKNIEATRTNPDCDSICFLIMKGAESFV